MKTVEEAFNILARDCYFWLPSFENTTRPKDRSGHYIPDSEEGFEYYCQWLTDYLTFNSIPVATYQVPIIKRLKKRKEISNAFLLGNAGFSSYYYIFNPSLKMYPKNFLDDPNPNRIKAEELVKFESRFGEMPKFRGLNANENLQISLIFDYISIQQYKLVSKLYGPIWSDMGWRALLKEGLQTVKDKNDKVKFTKHFIEEISDLNGK